jgi:hypothetical protein
MRAILIAAVIALVVVAALILDRLTHQGMG